jgi:hypothetical protein
MAYLIVWVVYCVFEKNVVMTLGGSSADLTGEADNEFEYVSIRNWDKPNLSEVEDDWFR